MARKREELVQVGGRLRGSMLVEQTDYTLALAKKELAALQPFGVTKETLEAAGGARKEIAAALGDRAVAEAEARASTGAQNEAMSEAKSWLRRAILVGQNAYDDQPEMVEAFGEGPKIGNSVPRLSEKVRRVVGLLRKDAARVPKFGAPADFVKRGEALVEALAAFDADQESKKAGLPKGTEGLYASKGTLYFLLKQINRAGRAAHVEDPLAAAEYNLSILHRSGAARKATATAAK